MILTRCPTIEILSLQNVCHRVIFIDLDSQKPLIVLWIKFPVNPVTGYLTKISWEITYSILSIWCLNLKYFSLDFHFYTKIHKNMIKISAQNSVMFWSRKSAHEKIPYQRIFICFLCFLCLCLFVLIYKHFNWLDGILRIVKTLFDSISY